jgi:hypothetical protein
VADDWVPADRPPFGDAEVDPTVFPSLRSVGSGVVARVNAAFLSSFQRLLICSSLQSVVLKYSASFGTNLILDALHFISVMLGP